MLTLEKFQNASKIVKEVTNPTPLVRSEVFSNYCGGEVYLKPENMQHTGSQSSEVTSHYLCYILLNRNQ